MMALGYRNLGSMDGAEGKALAAAVVRIGAEAHPTKPPAILKLSAFGVAQRKVTGICFHLATGSWHGIIGLASEVGIFIGYLIREWKI